MKKVLLLGSSGWVAHYTISDLESYGLEVIGFSNSKKPLHDIENHHFDIEAKGYIDEVKKIDCDAIINMLHSENFEKSFEVHCELTQYCKETGKHYTFLSSSNAFDGDVTREHYENERGNGGSAYGKYKVKCENFLEENMPEALAIRFSAVHGHAPNKVMRTENFLQRLKAGETISCYTRFFQGRLYIGHLSKMISKIVFEKESGTFHMAAIGASNEVDFLKRIATTFGYPEDQVIADKELDWNLTIVPEKIFKKYGDEYKFSEDDLIAELVECPHLSQYKS